MAVQQNQPEYVQGKSAPDKWLLSMALHNCWRRVDSRLSQTVKILRKDK